MSPINEMYDKILNKLCLILKSYKPLNVLNQL